MAGSVDVRFSSDGCTLAGTYTEAAAPIAAALVLAGSGRVNRDSDARLMRTGVTRAVAEALAAAHVSSLRYDKRGSGPARATTTARAWPTCSPTRTPRSAGWPAGPRTPPAGRGAQSRGHSRRGNGRGPGCRRCRAAVHARSRVSRCLAWQTAMLASRLPRAARVILWLRRTDIIRIQRKRVAQIKAAPADMMRIHGVRVNARWFKDFMACDPSRALARNHVPVLAITGGHDLQVQPEDVDAIGRLVKGPFEGHVAGDLSHLLGPILTR